MASLKGTQPSPEQSDWFQPKLMDSVLEDERFKLGLEKNSATFLLTGNPGVGKTTTMNGIKRHLQKRSSVHVAIAFFDANEPHSQRPAKIAMHLLWQLCSSSKFMCECVESLYQQKGDGDPSLGDIADALIRVIHERDHHCIMLDALDECKRDEDLIPLLETLARIQVETGVGIILTARTNSNIDDAGFKQVKERKLLSLKEDMTNYIKARLRCTVISKLPEVMDDAVAAIVISSGSLYVETRSISRVAMLTTPGSCWLGSIPSTSPTIVSLVKLRGRS
jgi:hypothetical protein